MAEQDTPKKSSKQGIIAVVILVVGVGLWGIYFLIPFDKKTPPPQKASAQATEQNPQSGSTGQSAESYTPTPLPEELEGLPVYDANELSTYPGDEGGWQCDGCIPIDEKGIVIQLEQYYFRKMKHISLANTVEYELNYYSGKEKIRTKILQIYEREDKKKGLYTHWVNSPEEAQGRGYDRLHIRAIGGKGSIAYIAFKKQQE